MLSLYFGPKRNKIIFTLLEVQHCLSSLSFMKDMGKEKHEGDKGSQKENQGLNEERSKWEEQSLVFEIPP